MITPSGTRVHAALALLAALALFGTACSDPGEEVTTTGSPGGRDDPLFVGIEVAGGFVPPGSDFRQVPTAVIYSDGQAFTGGAITLQFPGPAVLPVMRTDLTDAQIEDVLEAAEKAGLTDEPDDYGQPPVADAPTTTITVVTDGQTHTTSIEALQEAAAPMDQNSEPPPGMSEEAVEARRKAREFVDFVGTLLARSEAAEHEPDRYRVLPLGLHLNEPAPESEPGTEPQPQEKDWPFPHIALVENECVDVTGADAVNFRQTLREANEMTRWKTQSGEVYNLAVRPVLPHEPDCPKEQDPEAQDSGAPGMRR